MSSARHDRPHVVIVGAGFGGLSCAKALRAVDVDVTLVDRQNYHLFQPLLYQVATGLLDPSQIAYPVRSVFRRAQNVRVVMAEVTAVRPDARTITTSEGEIAYDALVLAAGSVTDYFGNESFASMSEDLKQLPQAIGIRSRLLRHFEMAAALEDQTARERLLSFVIVGGGPTGVEFAGALAELAHGVLPKDYPELDFSRVRVQLVEAGDRLLPAFAPRLSRSALRTLRRKHVDVRLQAMVQTIDADGVVLASGERIAGGMVMWSAGVRASTLGSGFPASMTKHGRLRVDGTLQLPGHDDIFVIGDMAAVAAGSSTLPMLAPVAIQGGQYVARVIAARLAHEPPPVFRYRDKGTMATIGRGAAVAEIGPLRISGLIGWGMWLFVHLVYLIGFRNRAITLAAWGWNYFVHDRPVRLITDGATATGGR